MSSNEAGKVIIAGWQPDRVWREFMALEAKDVGL